MIVITHNIVPATILDYMYISLVSRFVYPPHSNDKIKQANFAQLPSMRRWSVTKPIVLVVLMAFIGVVTHQVHIHTVLTIFHNYLFFSSTESQDGFTPNFKKRKQINNYNYV